jgi:hypothetical protein
VKNWIIILHTRERRRQVIGNTSIAPRKGKDANQAQNKTGR